MQIHQPIGPSQVAACIRLADLMLTAGPRCSLWCLQFPASHRIDDFRATSELQPGAGRGCKQYCCRAMAHAHIVGARFFCSLHNDTTAEPANSAAEGPRQTKVGAREANVEHWLQQACRSKPNHRKTHLIHSVSLGATSKHSSCHAVCISVILLQPSLTRRCSVLP